MDSAAIKVWGQRAHQNWLCVRLSLGLTGDSRSAPIFGGKGFMFCDNEVVWWPLQLISDVISVSM